MEKLCENCGRIIRNNLWDDVFCSKCLEAEAQALVMADDDENQPLSMRQNYYLANY